MKKTRLPGKFVEGEECMEAVPENVYQENSPSIRSTKGYSGRHFDSNKCENNRYEPIK